MTLGLGGLLFALVFTTTGCISNPDASPDASPTKSMAPADYKPTAADFAAIRSVLADRAAAINEGKRKAFLATLDPEADDDFAELQASYFANLRAIGATRMGYHVEDSGIVPATITHNHDPVLAPIVTEHFLIPRTDEKPLGDEVKYTFVRRDGRWFLGAEMVDEHEAKLSSPDDRFWYGVPIRVATRGGVLVAVDQKLGDQAEGLASAISTDLSSVEGFLDRESDGKVLVDATSTGAATTMDPTDDSEAAAVTFPVTAFSPDDDTWTRAGSRIKVNPGDVERLLDDRELLRHELTHFVMRDYSGVVPSWLSEGLAEYCGWDGLGLDRLQVNSKFYDTLMEGPHELPSSSQWGMDAARDYPIAHAAVAMLVRTYGLQRLFKLMDAYADTPAEPWGDSLTRRMLKRVYDLRPKTLTSRTFEELTRLQH
jgi:hypothetical protein